MNHLVHSFAFFSLACILPCAASEDLLETLSSRSNVILHVQIAGLKGEETSATSIRRYALCNVLGVAKGDVKAGDQVRISFAVFTYLSKEGANDMVVEREPFKVGKKYIVFLTGLTREMVKFRDDREPVWTYSLQDRWLGAQPYEVYMFKKLVDLNGRTPAKAPEDGNKDTGTDKKE